MNAGHDAQGMAAAWRSPGGGLLRYGRSVCAYSWRWQRRRIGTWLLTALVLGTVLSAAAVVHLFVWLGGGSLAGQFRAASEMQVFLADDATPDQVAKLRTRLASVQGVRRVAFRSKADAAALAAHDEQLARLAAASDGNPFPASLVVEMSGPEVGGRVLAAVARDPAVDPIVPASYTAAQTRQIGSALQALGIGSWALDAAALGIGALVSLALLRGELRARREELRVLALVGVPGPVIRMPLIVQAFSLGLAGGLLAAASLLYVGLHAVPAIDASLPFLHLGSPVAAVRALCAGVLVAGCAMPVAGALAVRLPR